ncbi:MAG: tetratricopeptide repeat protein [Alphaproteobacteria bacterium]
MKAYLEKFALIALVAIMSSGCMFSGSDKSVSGGISNSSSFGNGPEQIWLNKAKGAYKGGNYGLAERYYRHAIEERHQNAEAWLGLAASYDQLKRFDHAKRAYDVLVKISGYTPSVMNNLAYHHMLKGDFKTARKTLEAAQKADPNNPYVRNNIRLLNKWEAKARKARHLPS